MAYPRPRWGVLQNLGDHGWMTADAFDFALSGMAVPARSRLVMMETDPAERTVLLTFQAVPTTREGQV